MKSFKTLDGVNETELFKHTSVKGTYETIEGEVGRKQTMQFH